MVTRAHVRTDGELYQRPWPNPFSETWREAFSDGYDGALEPASTDKEYRDGFYTGRAQREWDDEELEQTGSSNA